MNRKFDRCLLFVTVLSWLWCRDCLEVIDRIHSFLKLDLKHSEASVTPALDTPQKVAPSSAAERSQPSHASDDAASATSSEESFELVGTVDIAEYDAADTDAKSPPAGLVSDQADEESATLDAATDNAKTSSSDDILYQ